MHKTKVVIYEKLQFLDSTVSLDGSEELMKEETAGEQPADESVGAEQQVITDNQEYYEVINIFIMHYLSNLL